MFIETRGSAALAAALPMLPSEMHDFLAQTRTHEVVLTTSMGHILWANGRALLSLQRPLEAVLGRPLGAARGLDLDEALLAAVFAAEGRRVELSTAEGATLDVCLEPILADDGIVRAVLVMLRDRSALRAQSRRRSLVGAGA